IPRRGGERLEFRDGLSRIVGLSLKRQHAHAFAQNGGAGDAAIGFVHARERLGQKCRKRLELLELGWRIGGEQSLSHANLKLRIRLLLFGRFLRERGKRFTAFLRLPLPEGDESLQILDLKPVEKI